MGMSTVTCLAVLCLLATAQAQDFTREVSSIDYSNLILNPLMAVINAQSQSLFAMLEYMNRVGFELGSDGNAHAIMMDFTYEGVDDNGDVIENALRVPVLCMVPIPYLRIDSVTIDFSTKLESSFKADLSMSFSAAMSFDTTGLGGYVGVGAGLSVSAQHNSTYAESRSYSMRVHVGARAADTPEGALKILDKLKASMKVKTKPASHTSSTGGV